jgi:hypothetical protein
MSRMGEALQAINRHPSIVLISCVISAFSAGLAFCYFGLEHTGRVIVTENELYCLKLQQDHTKPCGPNSDVTVVFGFLPRNELLKTARDSHWTVKRETTLLESPRFDAEPTAELKSGDNVVEVYSLNSWLFVRHLNR